MPETTDIQTLDIVRGIVGRRHHITRDEMTRILHELATHGLDLRNPYLASTYDGAGPAVDAWVRACQGICIISVHSQGLRDGYVRYDEPGSMHPMQHAEVVFADYDSPYIDADYLRQHADRVLLVGG